MAPVHVLDKYYLSITLLVTIGYQLLGFAIAWTLQVRSFLCSNNLYVVTHVYRFKFDKITDFTGGESTSPYHHSRVSFP